MLGQFGPDVHKQLLGQRQEEAARKNLFNFNSGTNRDQGGFQDTYTRSLDQYDKRVQAGPDTFFETLLGGDLYQNPFANSEGPKFGEGEEDDTLEQGTLRPQREGEDRLEYLESQVTPGKNPDPDEIERRMAVINERHRRYGDGQ